MKAGFEALFALSYVSIDSIDIYGVSIFKVKMTVTATCDSHYCACLGHLGWRNTNRNDPNCHSKERRHNIAYFLPTNFTSVHEPLAKNTARTSVIMHCNYALASLALATLGDAI